MFLSGTMRCADEQELSSVKGRLAGIPYVVVGYKGLEVVVEYTPTDRQTDREMEETIARLSDIIESVATHGLSLMTEKR